MRSCDVTRSTPVASSVTVCSTWTCNVYVYVHVQYAYVYDDGVLDLGARVDPGVITR